jgi:hypothetical protein
MTITNPNPSPDVSLENHHLPTNQQPPSTSTGIVLNGEDMNHHKSPNYLVTTSRSLQLAPLTDANNNMVNANFILVNNHLPPKYSVVNTSHGNKPLFGYIPTTNALVAVTNNNHQPSSMYGETTKYNIPVSTTNGHCQQLPPHILLPRSMTKLPSTIMELPTTQSCFVKTEPEDIKPVIGVDVPAFDQ